MAVAWKMPSTICHACVDFNLTLLSKMRVRLFHKVGFDPEDGTQLAVNCVNRHQSNYQPFGTNVRLNPVMNYSNAIILEENVYEKYAGRNAATWIMSNNDSYAITIENLNGKDYASLQVFWTFHKNSQ
jgi:hypothetical protein